MTTSGRHRRARPCCRSGSARLAADRPEAASARAAESETFGAQAQEVNARQMADLRPLFEDLGRRLDAMDAMGVDIQLISPSPVHDHDWAPLGAHPGGADHAHGQRRHRRAGGRRPAGRFGLGTAPLQHPQLAVDELTHAVTESACEASRSRPRRAAASSPIRRTRRSATRAETKLALSYIIFSGLLDRLSRSQDPRRPRRRLPTVSTSSAPTMRGRRARTAARRSARRASTCAACTSTRSSTRPRASRRSSPRRAPTAYCWAPTSRSTWASRTRSSACTPARRCRPTTAWRSPGTRPPDCSASSTARSRSGPHGADDGRGIWFGLVPLPGGSYMNYENERRGHRR